MASTGSVGTLSWSAKLDSNEFKKGVRRVKKEMKEAQKAVGQSLKMMAQSFTIATGAVAGLTGALAVLTKETADTVNAQNILAESIGSTQSEIAGLELASNALGVSYDQLIDKMREVGGVDAFKRLAEQVASAETATEQMTIAQQALGNEGLKLLPILQLGASGLADFERQARKLGLALPEDEVKALVDAWSDYEALQFRIIGLSRQLGAELAPLFEEILQDTVSFVDENSEAIKILFDSLGFYIGNVFDGIRLALESVGIVDEAQSWSDAILEVAFQIENSFENAFINIVKFAEKAVDFISYPFRKMLQILNMAILDLMLKMRDALAFVGQESKKLNEFIQKAVADDVFLEAGFSGLFSDEMVADFQKKHDDFMKKSKDRMKQIKEEQKAISDPEGFDIFGAIFTGFNKGMKAVKDGFDYAKNLEMLDDGKDDPVEVEVSRSSNILATAGSVEEFNLITAQRNQELDIAKKQLKELEKLNKDKSQDAGFNG